MSGPEPDLSDETITHDIADQRDQIIMERQAEIDRLQARVAVLTEALTELLHAVCGETGFAECVRTHANVAYPWPALDIAEERVRAALSESPTSEVKP